MPTPAASSRGASHFRRGGADRGGGAWCYDRHDEAEPVHRIRASGGRGGAGGASGGRGGTGASGPECATASDCKLVADCCTCQAIPNGSPAPACSLVCIQSQCAARQLPAAAVNCVAGRCVAGFACDTSQVTCRMAPPTCPAGEVPTVNASANCYVGSCAPATECTTVAGCASCTGAGEACVTYLGDLATLHHCVTIPADCGGGASCACLGSSSCLAPFDGCMEDSGVRGVRCGCPSC